ncbi:PREDICTED: E3 ubiquitin-protein ligase RHA2A [Ipomoea nil]|uniref:E3 ubiquitin-protein ligase RHA2A n=1 Tax=Ipomoea nil TaxID=35883 RepID=UPI000900EE6B|nr:PREDICTED: E3 ubiquitin-protein ligase RHA2A [Ipomoea nil]XP_019172431.1 PREDICTED: E3 ubiquitin-protein ligase RHA2A [Ipomoea nil]
MGLQNQLTDVSTESIPILMVVFLANAVAYLRSLVFALLRLVGLASRFDPDRIDDTLYDAVGSGLAGVIVLAEQLNLNRIFSYRLQGAGPNCVVCLDRLGDGDHVRKLDCRHVFHKECFDGWLDQLKFNCPLCRSPLVSDESVSLTRQRVAGDVLAWFSLR